MAKQSQRHVRIEPGEPPRPGKTLYHALLPSDLALKNALIEELMGALKGEGFLLDPNNDMRVRLCFDEALVNAIRHGNGCDRSRMVRVTASATAAKWNVLIEDEGEGFCEQDVPDPDDPASLLLESGRGLLIMSGFLSRCTHYCGGSALLMEKFEQRGREPAGRRKARRPRAKK